MIVRQVKCYYNLRLNKNGAMYLNETVRVTNKKQSLMGGCKERAAVKLHEMFQVTFAATTSLHSIDDCAKDFGSPLS